MAKSERFIKIHAVSKSPGNPVLEGYIRAETVHTILKAPEEHAKIGAASTIDDNIGTVYVTESVEEIREALEEALREPV